jgi:hypothetical protein
MRGIWRRKAAAVLGAAVGLSITAVALVQAAAAPAWPPWRHTDRWAV